MCQLFETIRIENGKLHNLLYHQQRIDFALSSLFDLSFVKLIKNSDFEKFSLLGNINIKKNNCSLKDLFLGFNYNQEKQKCKIVYSNRIESIEVEIYNERNLKKFKLVYNDEIEYSYKYLNRSDLDSLFLQKAEADDVIIIKNNRITDTSFANLIFFDGTDWITPLKPLLFGTMRAHLIKRNLIFEKELFKKDLKSFSYFLPINSMLGLDFSRALPINSIINLDE